MIAIAKKIKGYSVVKPEDAPAATADVSPSYRDDADRRLRLVDVPKPLTASLRWAKRPRLAVGNPAWTYMVQSPDHRFGVVIGHIQNGVAHPFEVWAIGEAPRGLTAIARSLSMDMRSSDRGWLRRKLESLAECPGEPFDMTMPDGVLVRVPSEVAAFARLVLYRCEELGAFEAKEGTPILDALLSRREPKTTGDGGLSWYVDIANPSTGDDFTLFVKEVILPTGKRRPLSLWLAGRYPRSLDGLCKIVSLDLQVVEAEWVFRKLQQLRSTEEVNGSFLAPVPGQEKSAFFPSTVAYIAELLLHRCRALGMEAEGSPALVEVAETVAEPAKDLPKGGLCGDCGAYAVYTASGCSTCGACGASACG